MAVNVISRPGQTNGSGADDAQFMRLFSGEVLTAFHQKNKLMQYQRTRTISGGKSATFPVTGTATAKYHTVGASVFGTDDGTAATTYLSKILSKEREIWVDDPLISGTFVPDIDRLKNHWDERSIYVNEIASALSDKADGNIARTLFAAALATPDFSGLSAAVKAVDDYADATVGANIAAFAFDVAELFDTYNIPEEGRILLLRPKQYYALAAEKDLVNRDWTSGSNGDYAAAKVLKVAGFNIVMTNSLPSTDEATAGALTGERNDPFGHSKGYLSPATNSVLLGALAFQTGAIGTVKMKELSTEQQYYMDRKGHLILSSYMMGHGVLRPECAAWMKSTTI